jgi:DNA-directed RNA polymerase specialized sigma24 family protein
MARIDWVRHRLENWARWCQQSESGALGYPKQSAFARLYISGGRNDSAVPISNLEASETDDAVKSLQFTQSHLYDALVLTYAKGLPRHLVAKRMGRAESTIRKNLEDAEHAIKRWLDDKQAIKNKQATAKSSFTS